MLLLNMWVDIGYLGGGCDLWDMWVMMSYDWVDGYAYK